MDGYAPAYVAHNVPYLVVSGLSSAPQNHTGPELEGVHIASDIPLVESDDADAIIKNFKNIDAEQLPWNSRANGGRSKFKIKIVGRVALQTREFLVPSLSIFTGIRFASPQCSTSRLFSPAARFS